MDNIPLGYVRKTQVSVCVLHTENKQVRTHALNYSLLYNFNLILLYVLCLSIYIYIYFFFKFHLNFSRGSIEASLTWWAYTLLFCNSLRMATLCLHVRVWILACECCLVNCNVDSQHDVSLHSSLSNQTLGCQHFWLCLTSITFATLQQSLAESSTWLAVAEYR